MYETGHGGVVSSERPTKFSIGFQSSSSPKLSGNFSKFLRGRVCRASPLGSLVFSRLPGPPCQKRPDCRP